MPSSSAQVTSAIVPCPQAVEYPALWKNTTPRSAPASFPADDVAAVHVRVAARLVDEQPPDVVEPLERVAPALEDRRALGRLDARR